MYVVDANIWIHLHDGNLLAEAFELPFEFVSPDVIVAELAPGEPTGETLLELGLRQITLAPESVMRIAALATQYTAPSVNDLFALVLAEQLGVPLLTGDGHLRNLAHLLDMQVAGVLWLLDGLIDHSIIKPPRAADSLIVMLDNRARLPEEECRERLRRWRA